MGFRWSSPIHNKAACTDLRPAGQPETPSFPGPDRTRPTALGLGNIFKNIIGSGRGILFRVGPSRGILFWVGPGRGMFLPGYETFSPGISGINLPFIPKQRKWNGYYP